MCYVVVGHLTLGCRKYTLGGHEGGPVVEYGLEVEQKVPTYDTLKFGYNIQ